MPLHNCVDTRQMAQLFSVIKTPSADATRRPWWRCCKVLLLSVALLSPLASGQPEEVPVELEALTAERQMLTRELDQYRKTLEVLQTDGTPAEQSSNPAVRKLAQEMVSLRVQLIAITEQEVTLLQERIIAAKAASDAGVPPLDTVAMTEPLPGEAIESKPLRMPSVSYSLEQEAENVERLHRLLAGYYAELQESAKTLPTTEEITRRETAQQDVETLAKIPFSADKVRLNGSEGSTALTQITQRLMDPTIPESRRDIAPICSIKTRLFGSLIGSENRSLKPVGKNHYVARVRLQPGDTTLNILQNRWEVRLPQDASASDFLITLYRPPGSPLELHVFALDDLLAEKNPHIPAWLPDELQIHKRAG
jgi:hypothetical protein